MQPFGVTFRRCYLLHHVHHYPNLSFGDRLRGLEGESANVEAGEGWEISEQLAIGKRVIDITSSHPKFAPHGPPDL